MSDRPRLPFNVLAPPPQPGVPPWDRHGHPWSEYVRRIDFVDPQPPTIEQPPVHGFRDVLIDGERAPFRVDPNGVTVDLSSRGATIVTMSVERGHVQIGEFVGNVYSTPHLLAGRRVLTPDAEGWEWTMPDDPEDPYVLISILVAEVHAR